MLSEPKQECIGVTNKVQNTWSIDYVVFLDYDNITRKKLIAELTEIVIKWKLGWTYIFETNDDKKHFHVICPTVISPYEYLGILWDSSCDMAYKKSFFVLKEKTLRVSSKEDGRKKKFPEFCDIIKGETVKPYSSSHLMFLKKMYGAPIPDTITIKTDCVKSDLEIVKYKTKHLNEG